MTAVLSQELQTWLDIATEAALAAGAVLQQHWGNLTQIQEKGRSGDLVTEADKAAEAAVMAVMGRHLPGHHSILAEESASRGTVRLNFNGPLIPSMAPLTTLTSIPFARSRLVCWPLGSRCWG